jgi:putative GTP pyrophosphokinase
MVSLAAVNRAGRMLRAWWASDDEQSPAVNQALEVMFEFRAAHQYPLGKANMGLRSVVQSEGCPMEISQRLKRAPTIVDKLFREPTMQLSTMQDIGGCRAVLESIEQVRAVERRLRKNRHPIRVYDYITSPRASGYRAVHVIVTYEDQERVHRRIEVQLRTKTMHEWAIAVERLSGRIRDDLKGSRGPKPVLDLLAAISKAMEIEERGETVPAELLADMGRLRTLAVPYMGGPTQ